MNKLVLAILILILFPLMAHAQDSIEHMDLGQLHILAITDAEGTMSKDLLPELSNFPAYAGVFEHGPVPSVVRTYFLKDGDHNILFDAGWGDELQKKGQTLELLKQAGIEPGSITDIILTHLDSDHIGGLLKKELKTYPNATLWISRPEYEAWFKGEGLTRSPSAIAFAQNVLKSYKGKIRQFDFGEEILPHIRAIDAAGHTPGHTAYEISSHGNKLIIAGDLLHIAPVQLPVPVLSTIYDMDQQKAAQTREKILRAAAKDGSLVAGMHFPMISSVLEREDGGFMMMQPR